MSVLNDPREMAIRPESGITLEEDNRYETMYHWGAHILDLCDLPVEEYMKPMTVNTTGGGGGGEGGDTGSTNPTYFLKFVLDGTTKKSFNLEEGAPIPDVPVEKEGYDFSGWADANGATPTSMPAANLTLYGTTTIKKFTVKFVVDGNELSEYEQTVNWNTKVTNIPASAKTGYTFSGWEPAIPSTIKNNYTFVGSFTKKSYTVSFNISGQVQTAVFEYGDTIEYPAADSKEGYTICGWTPYYETMPDTNNIVFKAILSANSYTVRYLIDHAGADAEVIAQYTVKYGQNIPTIAVPIKSGYTYTSWVSDEIIVNGKMPAYNVDYYTEESVNQYTLSYYVDGSQIGATRTYSYGAKVEPMAQYEKEGYTVTPWAYDHALVEIPQDLGGGYSMPYYNVVATCTTSINSYNVVIKHDNEVIFSGNVPYGTEISTLIPEGYSYNGQPSTVPASNIEIPATINSYDVVVTLSGKQPFTLELEYKSDIESAIEDYINENYPDEMVGHHIETNVPDGATVPAHDVNYTAEIVPNEHKINISGHSQVDINYGENVLDILNGEIDNLGIDEFHYFDGWEINGQPIDPNYTMPDEDIAVNAVIKVKESEVTPVVSGETSTGSTTYDYGTPISEVIEDIIASATPETQADLEDPGYAVEWTVNGSAYTEDMVVKEDEVVVEVSITPKPFMLSFMRRGSAAMAAGVVESGETLYKEEIVYPQLPANIEVSGVTYEFKWDEGSIEEGTPMPSRAVTVYGEYVEKPVVKTIYYGWIYDKNMQTFAGTPAELAELTSVEGMPSSKEFPFILEEEPGYRQMYNDWQDEEIEDEEFYQYLTTITKDNIVLLPESINKNDYRYSNKAGEVLDLEDGPSVVINGVTYSMMFWGNHKVYGGIPVNGHYAKNSQGEDLTIIFENKN